jgi:hypothetical protein
MPGGLERAQRIFGHRPRARRGLVSLLGGDKRACGGRSRDEWIRDQEAHRRRVVRRHHPRTSRYRQAQSRWPLPASREAVYPCSVMAWPMAALAPPYTLVTPQSWKKPFRLPAGSDNEASPQLALATWPKHASLFARKRDHGRAEAALIAHWAGERVGALGGARRAECCPGCSPEFRRSVALIEPFQCFRCHANYAPKALSRDLLARRRHAVPRSSGVYRRPPLCRRHHLRAFYPARRCHIAIPDAPGLSVASIAASTATRRRRFFS